MRRFVAFPNSGAVTCLAINWTFLLLMFEWRGSHSQLYLHYYNTQGSVWSHHWHSRHHRPLISSPYKLNKQVEQSGLIYQHNVNVYQLFKLFGRSSRLKCKLWGLYSNGIMKLPDKSSAADPLPVPVLKQVAADIAPFIIELFNRSLAVGHFPLMFRVAMTSNQSPTHCIMLLWQQLWRRVVACSHVVFIATEISGRWATINRLFGYRCDYQLWKRTTDKYHYTAVTGDSAPLTIEVTRWLTVLQRVTGVHPSCNGGNLRRRS